MKSNKMWESSPDEYGNVTVVELCRDSCGHEGIRYYIKGTAWATFINRRDAAALFSAMTHFRNEGGGA
jgi:hypothetical protein